MERGDEALNNLEKATFGAGCFWCIEAVFQQLKGVENVVSGYTGGHIKNPTYEEVCSGATGHAEVAQITYNPKIISFEDLLEVFFNTHDPTTLNKQGGDVGTQYRSAIFYHNEAQKELAELYIKKINESNTFKDPVVTEVTPLKEFYIAEENHQNFYNRNTSQPYCSYVVRPKVEKMKNLYKDKLKTTGNNE